ncbi:MAG: ATP-binding protein [Clostridiales bacterium]|nr:ATP-binding protein [Clostridiales bacterium]
MVVELLFLSIYSCAVITFCIGFIVWQKGNRKNLIDRLCFVMALCSGWWSLFFGLVLVQTEEKTAALLRSLGMIGVFALIICITYMMAYWSGVQGKTRRFVIGFAWLGIPLYPLTVQKSHIAFEMTSYGMSYQMNSGIWSLAYAFYDVVIALNLLMLVLYMRRKSTRRREKVMAYNLLACLVIVGLGSILDTVMPLVGLAAFPGSTIGQFIAVMALYQTYLFYKRSQMNLENMSQFVYYSVDEPVFLFDETEKLCIVNNGATVFLEMDAEECCRLSLQQIFELSRDPFRFQGSKNRVEARCIQNHNICSVSIDKIYDDYHDVIGYIVIVHDITERVHMTERLEQERKRADKANEAKGVFLANMSHEIRTPINAVMGMNEMIIRECEEDTILEYAQNIRDASKTLLALINDILDFSKIESGMMEVVEEAYSLRAMLKALEKECSMRAEAKGLALRFIVPADTPNVLLGDEVRVRQVLLNILTNAIKYTIKGSVTLTVSYERKENRQLQLTFAVTDTGIGIKEENIGRLFDKFDRVNEEQIHAIEGSGLGLSIVDRLLKLMHGTVKVESTFGEGSTFTVSLTQQIIEDQPIGSLHEERKEQGGRKRYAPQFIAPRMKVLVVDDNKVNLTVVKGLLRKTRMQITCVLSGKECLEAVRQEEYHIILLDYMMPEMDGAETLQRLKEMPDNKSREAAVIVLTANAMAGMKEMYLEQGFDAYISKPIDGTALERLLMEYIPEEYLNREAEE